MPMLSFGQWKLILDDEQSSCDLSSHRHQSVIYLRYTKLQVKLPLPHSQALKSARCAENHEEQASGGNRARPMIARVLERIGKSDTLLVVRIDRLARLSPPPVKTS